MKATKQARLKVSFVLEQVVGRYYSTHNKFRRVAFQRKWKLSKYSLTLPGCRRCECVSKPDFPIALKVFVE